MIILTGNSLGERQKELNARVDEVVSKKTSFEDVKTQTASSDVDTLFKIYLASKYENVEYILDILKCGDSLYISKALKCIWLYKDEHSNIINTEYLHNNIFPFMSTKMKKKLLVTISMHVKTGRATSFYTYCMNNKLENIAIKFLIFTPESFKLTIIQEERSQCMLQTRKNTYLKEFVGNSFVLAESYLNTLPELQRIQVLLELRYLYSVSEVKYLDLIENYNKTRQVSGSRLGLRISKDIMTKHMERIRINPLYYLNILNKSILVKHSTIDDAKLFVKALLPSESSAFWNKNFYETYKHLIDLIPFENRLQFLKKIFSDKFPGEEFETTFNFYNLQYYNMMTAEEREAWALCHVESGKELLGSGKDFKWYRFVKIEKALVEIKKFILLANDAYSRAVIMDTLVKCAKNDQDLEKLFHYYYERHVNEKLRYKERFIQEVLTVHNVYEFSDRCWTEFYKLLCSLGMYQESHYCISTTEYRTIALIYNLIHGKDIPEALKTFIESESFDYDQTQISKISKDKQAVVYEFILNIYLVKFTSELGCNDTVCEANYHRVRRYIELVLDLISHFDKTKEDIPDIILKHMKLSFWHEYEYHSLLSEPEIYENTQKVLLRLLKQNATLVISKLKETIDTPDFQSDFRKLFRKLKIYFSQDLAKIITIFFIELLTNPPINIETLIKIAVNSVLVLADETLKIQIVTKYIPTESKIDHSTVDENLLYIQKAICYFACYSRPPVPLSIILKYIQGDYVQYCLPIFNSYLANLPLPLCIEFTKSLVDAPVSVQKHGLRLAFQCFRSSDLSKLILDSWKKTRNVSMRAAIYTSLYAKTLKEDGCDQMTLCEVLNILTLDLHEDDYDKLFILVNSNDLPDNLITDYLDSAWKMINKPTQKQVHIERRTEVIDSITNKIEVLRTDFLESIIDDHLKAALDEKSINKKEADTKLIKAKWRLTTKYLVHYTNSEVSQKQITLTQFIIQKCINMWNKVHEGVYVVRKLCFDFIDDLCSECCAYDLDSLAHEKLLMELIIKELQEALLLHEIYETIWGLRLDILCRKIFIERRSKVSGLKVNDISVVLSHIEEDCTEFGKQFANMLIEFIEKDIYYPSFSACIYSNLIQCISCILEDFEFLDYFEEDLCPVKVGSFTRCNAQVLICTELLEFKTPETYMFALKVLPNEYPIDNIHYVKYQSALSKIKLFDNGELQCNLSKKFQFKYRDF